MDREKIGRYTVKEAIGSGSYGEVYRVTDLGADPPTDLALKRLRAAAPEEAVKRFKNEVWALRKLSHPSIPKFVDEGEEDGRAFFVMTLAEGRSLRRLYHAQCADGAPCGVTRILAILDSILDAVCHMHENGIVHRDIKDDNIIANESASCVTLVDLGFCRGQGQPAEHQTFWNAGASRYSPPEKLAHPSVVTPNHDVFAVGVVAYLMLTNRYPWDVAEDEDAGVLQQRMRDQDPASVHSENPFVSREVSACISRMLDPRDETRPSAAQVRAEIAKLREAAAGGPIKKQDDRISFPRVIRDPIHGDIRMTEFEWRLLGCPEMQRLRWMKQLGFTSLVYPGAEHTRFSHSIGAMHVADRILRSIEDHTGTRVEAERRLMARSYALVHDIAHVPYGHTLEDELGILKSHDGNDARISRLLLSDKSSTGNLLRSTDFGRAVLAHFDPGMTMNRAAYLDELLTGPLGADVIDYVDRDSFYCGLDHRIDTSIYRRFRFANADRAIPHVPHLVARLHGGMGLRLDAEFAVEAVLLARFSLFMKVYTHPMKLAADAMLGKALAAGLGGKRPVFTEQEIERLSDVELLAGLKNSNRAPSKNLAERLFARRLYKPVFMADALDRPNRTYSTYDTRLAGFREKGLLSPEGRREIESKIATLAGVPGQEFAVYCSSKAPGLKRARQYVEKTPGRAEIADELYSPHEGIIQRHLALWKVYVFANRELDQQHRTRLAEACESTLQLTNSLPIVRQQRLF